MVVFTFSEVADVKVPYETIGLTVCAAVTLTYLRTRLSGRLVYGFVTGVVAHGFAGVVAVGQATAVLSTQVQVDVTFGVIPDGKRFRAVSWAPVTFGFALPTSAPARVAPSRAAESPISNP
jgi:hypothetical protein